MKVRELYCPAHFGNAYEVAMRGEMRACLEEARFWGFNRYSDWFDTVDLDDVYARGGKRFDLPEAMWARKFEHFATAAGLGFDLGLVITPNHVFANQVTEANAATLGPHYFGQLVCPHRAGATELILGNYARLFDEFVRRGLRLRAVSAGAYDYGGCGCPACQPWIVTFGKLARAIVELARERFGEVDADLWGWWWSDDDHAAFTAWADREATGFFRALAHYLPYGQRRYEPRPIPTGAGERAFVHIGYGETGGIDVYGHLGPTVAPERLEATVAFLRERGADGFLAYSEGLFDDVNKALLAGLASGQFADAEAVLRAYAERYFGNDPPGWAAFLRECGDAATADPTRLRPHFDRLAVDARPSWRLAQWDGKLRLLEADAAGRAATDDHARREARDRFDAAKEYLWRDVWRRGLGRHIFRFDWKVPAWYAATPVSQHPEA